MRFEKHLRFSGLMLLVGLFAIAAFTAQVALAQSQDDVIRVNTELVVIDAQVLHKKTGRIIGSLAREDFQLYEDGVKQEITFFSQDKLPLSVVLLFDLTETVRPVLKPLARGALQALQHLKPEDEVAVMAYAASTVLIQDFTTDRKLIMSAIEQASTMELHEPAFFNEGVFQAAAHSTKSSIPSSRRVIIWLTDNQPNIPSEWMRKMTSIPAGELLAELIDHIRTRYSFGYRPSVEQPAGRFCKIKLTLTPKTEKREGKVAVRTSAGYYRGARHKNQFALPARPVLKPERP